MDSEWFRTGLPCHWGGEVRKCVPKEVYYGQISTVNREIVKLWPFVVPFRLDYEDDVSSVRPSSLFSD